jgi:hypothetical protein
MEIRQKEIFNENLTKVEDKNHQKINNEDNFNTFQSVLFLQPIDQGYDSNLYKSIFNYKTVSEEIEEYQKDLLNYSTDSDTTMGKTTSTFSQFFSSYESKFNKSESKFKNKNKKNTVSINEFLNKPFTNKNKDRENKNIYTQILVNSTKNLFGGNKIKIKMSDVLVNDPRIIRNGIKLEIFKFKLFKKIQLASFQFLNNKFIINNSNICLFEKSLISKICNFMRMSNNFSHILNATNLNSSIFLTC